ncbi:MAG: EAL domain-containing protein [Defluviitaleaceae bacterium]|nr:EAL domain-containing protein [Defluviitaleaceae bacterium]
MDIRDELNRLNTILKANLIGTFSAELGSDMLELSPDTAKRLSMACTGDCNELRCRINCLDFADQVHPHDRFAITKAFEKIKGGTWDETDFIAFRFPSAKDYEWLSLKVTYLIEDAGKKRVALGSIADYTTNMRLLSLNTLALEGASKYNFFYEFKTDSITFSDAFTTDYKIPSSPIKDALDFIHSRIADKKHIEEFDYYIGKIISGESDTFELRLRIFNEFAKAMEWLHLRGKCSRSDCGTPIILAGSILDITSQVRSEELNSLIMEGSSDCVFVYDIEKDIFEFSSKIFELIPLKSRRVMRGMETWLNFIVPSDHQIFESAMNKITSGEADTFKAEFRIKGTEASPFWVACSGKCSFDESGKPSLIAGSIMNMESMSNFTNHMDSTVSATRSTALPNRIAFYQDINSIIQNFGQGTEAALGNIILVDIDGFGSINSLHGLLIGDRMLMEYGTLLSMLVPYDGKLYHFGNNLFAIYLKSTNVSEVNKISEDIRKYSANGLLVEGIHLVMTVSIGVAEFSNHDKVDDILVNAELALRRAKDVRNSIVHFKPEYRKRYLDTLNLEQALSECVLDNFRGFEVFYQPLYATSLNMFIGAEALLRWKDADGRVVSPLSVIPALERIKMFDEVESWIFRTAAKQCAQWIKLTGIDDFAINVNMSPKRASSGGLAQEVQDVLAEFGLSMDNIFFELTEEGVIMSSDSNLQTLTELKSMGARISLDDFGTGYSSLGHLRHLPICELKIDRSFVIDIETNEKSREFLSALISLAHIMNYIVCVEGIETIEQLRIVNKLGADLIQGYYFSPPIPAAKMEADILLTQNTPDAILARQKEIWAAPDAPAHKFPNNPAHLTQR